MSNTPTLVFVPGAWHKPSCYNKIIEPLQNQYNIKCVPVTLPSTTDNPNATFKDDIDATRDAIISETTQGRDVIVIAHSYGGMVGNSAIKGLTRHKSSSSSSTSSSTNPSSHQTRTHPEVHHPQPPQSGSVTALVLIASGFTITGLAFMDPFFGIPPPFFRMNKDTGYAELVADPRDFFYHDLPTDEAGYWADQLTTQSLKALFEGGEHAYAGWQDVPTWYLGTIEDRGMPVVLQRVQVGVARGIGATVHHVEFRSSHSPFLSVPDEVVEVVLDVVRTVSGSSSPSSPPAGAQDRVHEADGKVSRRREQRPEAPMVRFAALGTWFKFGLPLFVGRVLGWGAAGFIGLRRAWRRRRTTTTTTKNKKE